MKLGTVRIRLNQWRAWEQSLKDNLELEPGEDAHTANCPTLLRLPAVLILDYERQAQQAGWTFGQFLSFLVVQGAMRVVEREGKV